MIYWEKQRKTKTLYELFSRPVREKYRLTQMEYSVLLFLGRNPEEDTASAIVRTGQFTKSHVSSAIKSLGERGLLTGEFSANNSKTIHLKLTDQAEAILQEAEEAAARYKKCLFEGFTGAELQQMRSFFERICENAETALKKMEE